MKPDTCIFVKLLSNYSAVMSLNIFVDDIYIHNFYFLFKSMSLLTRNTVFLQVVLASSSLFTLFQAKLNECCN